MQQAEINERAGAPCRTWRHGGWRQRNGSRKAPSEPLIPSWPISLAGIGFPRASPLQRRACAGLAGHVVDARPPPPPRSALGRRRVRGLHACAALRSSAASAGRGRPPSSPLARSGGSALLPPTAIGLGLIVFWPLVARNWALRLALPARHRRAAPPDPGGQRAVYIVPRAQLRRFASIRDGALFLLVPRGATGLLYRRPRLSISRRRSGCATTPDTSISTPPIAAPCPSVGASAPTQ